MAITRWSLRVLCSDVQQRLAEASKLAGLLLPARHSCSRIIVVDDDSVELESYRAFLCQLSGVRIELAMVFSGMLKVAESKPVMVISKLKMAPFDGFQMIRILKEDKGFRDLKVVALSALSDAEISSCGGLPRNVIHIREPVDLYELKNHVA